MKQEPDMFMRALGWELGDTFHVTTDKEYRLGGKEVKLASGRTASVKGDYYGFRDEISGESEYILSQDVKRIVKLTVEQTAEAIDKLTLELDKAEEEVSKANQNVATIEEELYSLQHSLEKLGFDYTPKSQRS